MIAVTPSLTSMSAEPETKSADPEEAPPAFAPQPAAEARLLARLRQGDPEAGRQLVRDYYPGVYRYLVYLTGRPELAEDPLFKTNSQRIINRKALIPLIAEVMKTITRIGPEQTTAIASFVAGLQEPDES